MLSKVCHRLKNDSYHLLFVHNMLTHITIQYAYTTCNRINRKVIFACFYAPLSRLPKCFHFTAGDITEKRQIYPCINKNYD